MHDQPVERTHRVERNGIGGIDLRNCKKGLACVRQIPGALVNTCEPRKCIYILRILFQDPLERLNSVAPVPQVFLRLLSGHVLLRICRRQVNLRCSGIRIQFHRLPKELNRATIVRVSDAAEKQHGTVNRELSLLRGLYKKAIEWNLAEINPTIDVSDFKESDGRARYLTEEEGAKVLANCKPNLRLLVLAALHTGFRTSELKQTTWARVDFLNRSVTVPNCYAKNDETRTVPMHPDLEGELRAVYETRQPKPENYVFLNDRDGMPYKSWRTAFKTALRKAGITDFVFHDLRHCFGSYLGMANTNPKAMQELMGHKRIEMTMRYTHLSVDYKRAAVAKLPSFGKMETESQRISQQPQEAKVVGFGK
jgi:integrase